VAIIHITSEKNGAAVADTEKPAAIAVTAGKRNLKHFLAKSNV
jgi:hypothetical protein